MQTSHNLESDMSRNSPGETRAEKFHLRRVPQQVASNMKVSRVAMPHQLRKILQHCQATEFLNFLARDELWFFLECPYDDVWAASRDEVLATPMTTIEII
jgi:hypothetical protein